VGAAWGEPACLLLAMAGFIVQAWAIVTSSLRQLDRLPEAVA